VGPVGPPSSVADDGGLPFQLYMVAIGVSGPPRPSLRLLKGTRRPASREAMMAALKHFSCFPAERPGVFKER